LSEKRYKTIIIVLSIVAAISIGLCIYFGTADPSRTGEELASTVAEQEHTILDQRRTIEELQSDLSGARESVEEAYLKAQKAEQSISRALVISDETRSIMSSIQAISEKQITSFQDLTKSFNEMADYTMRLEQKVRTLQTELRSSANAN
jgi:chromosome segregation ATPase